MKMKILNFILLLFLIIFLSNCATSYRIINPTTLHYTSEITNKDIFLEYRYGLLHKKYTSKEIDKNIRLVAVKITNNSDQDLIFGKDFTLGFENGTKLEILENEKVYKKLKQSVPVYLFYFLLTPFNLLISKTNSYGTQEPDQFIPIGLILGPALATSNMAVAGSSNGKFRSELTQYNILGITIKKGETVHGLVGIKALEFGPINIKLK
jgi:hypothetical protein